MLTVPKELLQKMCSDSSGINSNKWYCENLDDNLILDYNIVDDFFSISDSNEELFCRDYVEWYDKQFCGSIQSDFEQYMEQFNYKRLQKTAERNVLQKEFIYEMLICSVPEAFPPTTQNEAIEALASSIYNEMVLLSKGELQLPNNHETIYKRILHHVPQSLNQTELDAISTVAKLIYSHYIRVTKTREEMLTLVEESRLLNEKAQAVCFIERDESAREVNNYCANVIGKSEAVTIATAAVGSAGGTGAAINWKKIWNALKWLWNNKSKISKTLKAIAGFLDKLGNIWSKKGNDSKTPTTKKTEVQTNVNVSPKVENVRSQLILSSNKIREMDAKLQREITTLAINQWNELAPQKQARFLTEDARMPEPGFLPNSYVLDFVERSNRTTGSNQTTHGVEPAEIKAPKDGQPIPEEKIEATSPEQTQTAQTDIALENEIIREFNISRVEARKLIAEGKSLWERLSPADRISLFGAKTDRPNLNFFRLMVRNSYSRGRASLVDTRDMRRGRDKRIPEGQQRIVDHSKKIRMMARR